MNLRAAWHRGAPAVGLFFLAPFVAEFLLGDFAFNGLFTLLVMAPLYGGGAIVIRETVRRAGRGWPSILVLGLAYGVLEEGLVTQSLFNPDYGGLRLLDPAYIPALGIGASWTLFVLSLHAVWSIGASIGLAEALAARRDPGRETAPWLRRGTLTVAAVMFVLGSIAIGLGTAAQGFMASSAQLAGATVTAAVLVVVAFRLPRSQRSRPSRAAPRPLVVIVVVYCWVRCSSRRESAPSTGGRRRPSSRGADLRSPPDPPMVRCSGLEPGPSSVPCDSRCPDLHVARIHRFARNARFFGTTCDEYLALCNPCPRSSGSRLAWHPEA